MQPAVERSATADGVAVAAGAVLFGALFFADGTDTSRLLWIGGAALAVAVLALAVGVRPRLGPAAVATLALATAFAGWNGLSLLWSITPDRSWDAFNRALVYLGFLCLGLLAGRRPRVVAAGLALLLALVLGWALLGKVVPALFPGGARLARLSSPVGYWNGLAVLADVAVPLGLWLASRREHRAAARIAGTLLVYGAIVTAVLTYSRAGVAVAALAALAWVAAGGAAFESLGALAVAAPLAAAASGIAFALPGVVDDNEPYATRVDDGAWFGLAFVGLGVLLVGLALLALRREDAVAPEPRRRLTRGAAGVLVAALVAALVVSAVRGGGWAREFRGSGASYVSEGAGRLGELGSNNRWQWWQEAWRIFTRHPLDGTGAGSFEIARQQVRTNELVTLEPHNLALQFLSDLGIVGFLLAAATAVAAAVAVVGAVRRLAQPERAAATALALALPVYALESLVDFHWDFLAVSAPVAFALGSLLAAGAPAWAPAPRFALVPATALVLGVVCSLVLPWLAARRVSASFDAAVRGDTAQAVADARSANDLNPFSPEPLYQWAFAEALAGRQAKAVHLYERAAVLQPSNGDTWYQLGLYEARIGRLRRAWRDLNWAYGLDPHGRVGDADGALAQVRKKLFG